MPRGPRFPADRGLPFDIRKNATFRRSGRVFVSSLVPARQILTHAKSNSRTPNRDRPSFPPVTACIGRIRMFKRLFRFPTLLYRGAGLSPLRMAGENTGRKTSRNAPDSPGLSGGRPPRRAPSRGRDSPDSSNSGRRRVFFAVTGRARVGQPPEKAGKCARAGLGGAIARRPGRRRVGPCRPCFRATV